MTMQTDAERLREIRERLEAATPGPWEWEEGVEPADDGGHLRHYVGINSKHLHGGGYDRDVTVMGTSHLEAGKYAGYAFIGEGDAAFIAHALADVAWLLERNARRSGLHRMLRDAFKRETDLRVCHTAARRLAKELRDEVPDALRSQVDRLVGVLRIDRHDEQIDAMAKALGQDPVKVHDD
jgi:hypothetical protein